MVASAVNFGDIASIRNSVRLDRSLSIASFVNSGSSLSAGFFVRLNDCKEIVCFERAVSSNALFDGE